jgi:hypothetical protein
MCGDTSKGAMSWRGNCHMDDEVPGGFHDAGDHAMFGLPQGFTASTLEWAYYEFPDAFDKTGQTEHLKVITDHFCDFFKRSTKLSGDTVTNFLYMKGDGDDDHSYWGPPESQGGSRAMFWTSNGASEIAAEYAAALAAHYKNFGDEEALKYAKALYKFSKQYNQAAPCKFYGSNSVADDQAWAAGWLYIATGDGSYLNDSKNFPNVGWVHGWNDTHLGAACLYGENAKNWSAANGYISRNAQGSNYLFLDKWGSARLNCSMQFTSLVATKHGAGNYKDWAKGQMNYILGQNPANTCFVTGFASNSAKNVHHRAASGYTGYGEFNGNGWKDEGNHMEPFAAYGPNSHTLIGALAGGPCDASGTYHDNMNDYVCNEVAIDYNAGLVGAAAGLYHFFGGGSIDTTINGVTKIYNGSSQPPVTTTTTQGQTPVTTTTTTQGQTPVTTTTNTPPSNKDGEYTVNPKKEIDYSKLPENDKMVGFPWKDFGVKSGEYATKIEFKISSSKDLGTWVGAFGSSTTQAPDYWTMSEDSTKSLSGTSATLTWEPSAADAKIFAYSGGELKLGIWWIDCGQFTVDSITVYTAGGGSQPVVTTTTTRATTTTTTTIATQAPVTTTTTQAPVTTTTTTTAPHSNIVYGDVNLDGYVSISDAVAILQYIANRDKYNLNDQQKANADVSGYGDGVTANDALTIQMVDAKVLSRSQLPVR